MSNEIPTTPLRPFDAIMLNVGDGHWLYVEQVGIRGGVPALFLHGGPGSGAQHSHRNIFDPNTFHAFLFDQRGAGRSRPYLSIAANDTTRQIDDIERIRAFYGIEQWLVVGGSWGSTLALAYAQAHPNRVSGLVLRAVFLGTREEVQWAFIDGPKTFHPALYHEFVAPLSEAEKSNPIEAYGRRLRDPDPAVHKPASERWHAYERALSELTTSVHALPPLDACAPDLRLKPTPIMEAHYIANNFFLKPHQLRDGMHRIAQIPGAIIQGRYDLLCPPRSAFAIAGRWPKCQLKMIDAAGHAMTEPGVADAMQEAVNELATRAS